MMKHAMQATPPLPVSETPPHHATTPPGLGLLAAIALIPACYHMLTTLAPGYGYFIDELYYIACAKRLAFGYVDHPPLSVALLALVRAALGESVPALRLLPALAHGATVFMAGLLARRLGGSRAAMALAALAAMAHPAYLVFGSFYSMNAFEPLIFSLMLYGLIRMIQEGNPRWWLLIGALTGLGVEMKHTLVAYCLALGIGLIITPARRLLWNRWFALGGLAAAVLIAPNILWQAAHGFPSLEFYRNASLIKNIPAAPGTVAAQQFLFANPFAFPLWAAGLLFFFFARAARPYRFAGWTYLALLAMLIASKSSRPDRIAAIYLILFAGGAAAIQGLAAPAARRAATALMAASLIFGAAFAAPIFTPLLPPAWTKSFLNAIGFSFSAETGKRNTPLPPWFSDRFGWRELAEAVAKVYRALPPEDQRAVVIVGGNYAHAGALELFGPELGLPPRVYCAHNNYHLWGPPAESAQVYIGVSGDRKGFERMFQSVSLVDTFICELGTNSQGKVPIYVMRGPKFSVTKEWPKFKNYI